MSNRPGCNSIAQQHSSWGEHRFSISLSIFHHLSAIYLPHLDKSSCLLLEGKKPKCCTNALFLDQVFFEGVFVLKSLPASWRCCSAPTATASRSWSPASTCGRAAAAPRLSPARWPLIFISSHPVPSAEIHRPWGRERPGRSRNDRLSHPEPQSRAGSAPSHGRAGRTML